MYLQYLKRSLKSFAYAMLPAEKKYKMGRNGKGISDASSGVRGTHPIADPWVHPDCKHIHH